MDIVEEIYAAEGRIRPHIRETYLTPSPYFSALSGAEVYFKQENLQHTGSFKVRGALNKVLSLPEADLKRGVVTASTGNHGLAVAYSLEVAGAKGSVFVPENASKGKVAAIQRMGVPVKVHGTDSAETEGYARAYAERQGLTFVSPYNDPQVVGGQGTLGIELARQAAELEVVFIALGGGGLISGIAALLKSLNPQMEIIGCSPENSQVMIQSLRAGEILDLASHPTLSDGTAGGVEPGSITFALCQDLVDDLITVSEEEIAAALLAYLDIHHMLVEGAAAVPLAALLKHKARFADRRAAIVLCGANISLETLRSVLQSSP
jgi:threonine dehydratase